MVWLKFYLIRAWAPGCRETLRGHRVTRSVIDHGSIQTLFVFERGDENTSERCCDPPLTPPTPLKARWLNSLMRAGGHGRLLTATSSSSWTP